MHKISKRQTFCVKQLHPNHCTTANHKQPVTISNCAAVGLHFWSTQSVSVSGWQRTQLRMACGAKQF